MIPQKCKKQMEKKNNGKGKVFLSKRNKKLNAISFKKNSHIKLKINVLNTLNKVKLGNTCDM